MTKFLGYIEGYYGRLLSWSQRREILDALSRLSLNTYVYGPKEDPFHRYQWKRPYPQEWRGQFKRFISDATKKNVLFIPSVSPGLSYDYESVSDYRILKNKFMSFADCGARTIALFMDDIPEVLPQASERSFTSLGQAHALLLQKLLCDMRKRHPKITLWFCPTVYCDQFAKGRPQDNRYLTDLARDVPGDVRIFWTGPSVISKTISAKSIAALSGLFGGNIVIWDNLYAHDYCPHKLFTGPYRGRPNILSVTNGVCLNPTGLVKTDILLLWRLSALCSPRLSPAAPGDLFPDILVPDAFAPVARFFDSPFENARLSDLSPRKRSAYRKALKYLVWEWKSPLQREWYPFLFMLDVDLNLMDKSAEISAWIMKKYPPVLSTVLTKVWCAKRRRDM